MENGLDRLDGFDWFGGGEIFFCHGSVFGVVDIAAAVFAQGEVGHSFQAVPQSAGDGEMADGTDGVTDGGHAAATATAHPVMVCKNLQGNLGAGGLDAFPGFGGNSFEEGRGILGIV